MVDLHRSPRVSVCCAVALLLSSVCLTCGGDTPGGGDTSTPPSSTRLSITPEVGIDGYDHDLVPVNWLAVDGKGVVAVAQWQDGTVRFFGPEGEPLGSVGRTGEGPEEFQSMARAGWSADTLWVLDGRQNRLTLVSPERTFVRTERLPNGAMPASGEEDRMPRFRSIFPYARYPDGSLHARVHTVEQPVDGFDASRPTHVLVAPDGTIRRVVLQYPEGQGTWMYRDPDGHSAGGRVPFGIEPKVDVAPDGSRIALVTTDVAGSAAGTFQVTMVDRKGDTLYVRRFPYRGVPIPEQVGDSAMHTVADRWRDRGRPEVAEAFEEQVTIPRVYPPVESALVGRDENLWIRLRDTDEGRPYLALDTVGEPIGTAYLPRSAEVLAADRSHLWTVERDELDVPSVVRYRVEEPVDGG